MLHVFEVQFVQPRPVIFLGRMEIFKLQSVLDCWLIPTNTAPQSLTNILFSDGWCQPVPQVMGSFQLRKPSSQTKSVPLKWKQEEPWDPSWTQHSKSYQSCFLVIWFMYSSSLSTIICSCKIGVFLPPLSQMMFLVRLLVFLPSSPSGRGLRLRDGLRGRGDFIGGVFGLG